MDVNVLLIERAAARRNRLSAALSQGQGITVVGAFGGLDKALADGPKLHEVDVLVINADRPGAVAMRFWARLRSFLGPGARVVALTRGDDPRVLENVLGVGVAGLHPPEVTLVRLARAIRAAAQGRVDFDPGLSERAKVVLMGPPEVSQIRLGGLEIDLRRHRVRRWRAPIQLSGLEFELLACLARAQDRTVGTAELLESVWGVTLGKGGTADQVKSLVRRLRKKIEPDPKRPRYLITVRGQGYVLQDPVPIVEAH